MYVLFFSVQACAEALRSSGLRAEVGNPSRKVPCEDKNIHTAALA